MEQSDTTQLNIAQSHPVKISVRSLVEFIMRSGDINTSSIGIADKDAMSKGSKLHRKLQRRMGSNYTAEYPLSIDVPVTYGNKEFLITVDGRADGILIVDEQEDKPGVYIDEIKGTYLDIGLLEEPFHVHLAQAKCYAYIYGKKMGEKRIGVRMTYAHIETELTKYFEYSYEMAELTAWFHWIIMEYAKWANMEMEWKKERDASLKVLEFPFSYRPGQKKLVTGVYQTILREKRLYLEAPTGVGKTISTIFPAVKAMGEGLVEKIFYLTAKTITRTVAEETFGMIKLSGARLKVVTLTAKDKICIKEEVKCNPEECPRAKGHYDRVNDALFDLVKHEVEISREIIEKYATTYEVCPFELALDVSLWCDGIICDYNYVFDPRVQLKRFFMNDKKSDYVFLIDEAHNLVDRAREMYSARLVKEDFLEVKRMIKGKGKQLEKQLEICNRELLKWKRESDTYEILDDIDSFYLQVLRLSTILYEFLREHQVFEQREIVLNFYFEVSTFLAIYEICNSKYLIYTDFTDKGEFTLTLQCMDPSSNINNCLEKGRSAIFFSATLLPIAYYKEQLAGREEDYAIYAETVFDPENRRILVAEDVSTKYTRRTESEYDKVTEYISIFVQGKIGNYLVFFPSYQYMEQILERIENKESIGSLVVQNSHMSEEEREDFLGLFEEEPKETRVGFCVMGGIFSEGIDLKADRLIGTVIVGTGLPMVCTEKEIFRQYYEEKNGSGFAYSYLYPGMNKVLQSGGRVIRTEEDRGIILLLDERFLRKEYLSLFPREWFPYTIVNRNNLKNVIEDFWK